MFSLQAASLMPSVLKGNITQSGFRNAHTSPTSCVTDNWFLFPPGTRQKGSSRLSTRGCNSDVQLCRAHRAGKTMTLSRVFYFLWDQGTFSTAWNPSHCHNKEAWWTKMSLRASKRVSLFLSVIDYALFFGEEEPLINTAFGFDEVWKQELWMLRKSDVSL